VTISRAVPAIQSERPAETRDFFVDLLGFQVAMDMGWVVTVASPTNQSAQVTIVSDDDMAGHLRSEAGLVHAPGSQKQLTSA
jgi:hypothetical protein